MSEGKTHRLHTPLQVYLRFQQIRGYGVAGGASVALVCANADCPGWGPIGHSPVCPLCREKMVECPKKRPPDDPTCCSRPDIENEQCSNCGERHCRVCLPEKVDCEMGADGRGTGCGRWCHYNQRTEVELRERIASYGGAVCDNRDCDYITLTRSNREAYPPGSICPKCDGTITNLKMLEPVEMPKAVTTQMLQERYDSARLRYKGVRQVAAVCVAPNCNSFSDKLGDIDGTCNVCRQGSLYGVGHLDHNPPKKVEKAQEVPMPAPSPMRYPVNLKTPDEIREALAARPEGVTNVCSQKDCHGWNYDREMIGRGCLADGKCPGTYVGMPPKETKMPIPQKTPEDIREVAADRLTYGKALVAVCPTKHCTGWCYDEKSIGTQCSNCGAAIIDARPFLVPDPPQKATPPMSNIDAPKLQHPMLKTLEVDATEAAWRMAGSQFLKLAKDPIVALLSRHLGPGDESLRAKIATFLETELGTAILSGVLSAGLSAMPPQMGGAVSQRLSRELRVKSMATAGEAIAEVLLAPLRQVAVMYLQDAPSQEVSAPAKLPDSSRLPLDEVLSREEVKA